MPAGRWRRSGRWSHRTHPPRTAQYTSWVIGHRLREAGLPEGFKETVGADVVSQDMLITVTVALEKHLRMMDGGFTRLIDCPATMGKIWVAMRPRSSP